jgi:hypothetical protein
MLCLRPVMLHVRLGCDADDPEALSGRLFGGGAPGRPPFATIGDPVLSSDAGSVAARAAGPAAIASWI